MADVTLRNIVKSFNDVEILKGIDLRIADGEMLILVGPSGCGKSTLLRIIAGLEDATNGDITIGGRRVNDVSPSERDIAMVFQSYALYPHMTAAQNMAFALEMARVPKAEIEQRVARAAEILDLGHLLQRRPSQLSGGQRQRVAMGRAIVRDPQVFLFDEPLSNLDAKLRVSMRSEIKDLHRRLNATMIYVTHDQIEAMTMADRIVVMDAGRISQLGTPLELYDRPANLFVAAFIGSPSMNFFDGTLVAAGTGSELKIDDVTWPLPDLSAQSQEVRIGVRPDFFRLGKADEQGALAAAVVDIEPTGSETHVMLERGGRQVMVLLRDRTPLERGEIVHLVPDLSRISVFSSQSGQRLPREGENGAGK